MSARPAYHHGDLRNALLDAADELLQKEGLQGFTLRACARLAGVSHAAPKHHFGDVRGLLGAVAERGYTRLVERLEAELAAAAGDLDAEMFATAKAYVEFAESWPEHFRIMFRADLLAFDMNCPPEPMLATFTNLTNVILRQRGEPELSPADMGGDKSASLVNDILLGWCHIHGYAHLRLEGRLSIIDEGSHLDQLRLSTTRLAHLIQAGTAASARK